MKIQVAKPRRNLKSFTIVIFNFCNFLNQILFYFNVIEFNTVKRIYTQLNFTQGSIINKMFYKILYLVSKFLLKKIQLFQHFGGVGYHFFVFFYLHFVKSALCNKFIFCVPPDITNKLFITDFYYKKKTYSVLLLLSVIIIRSIIF